MSLIDQLQRDPRFFAQCPSCGGEFQVSKAVLFHVRDTPPPEALKKLVELRDAIRARREEMAKKKKLAAEKAAITAESVNLGNVLEKIAPTFRSFEFAPADCRALFEPIDYLIFKGLAKRGTVDRLVFVDVKSGKARLKPSQKAIKEVVERGKLRLRHIPRKERSADND